MRKSGRPTMVDVAADAGVSFKTVSRVVNEQPNVDPTLAARVRASVERLGFRRNALAASLRSGSADTIGFVSADLTNTFYMSVAAAASAVVGGAGLQLLMASSEENADAERRIALDLCNRQVGGLIVAPAAHDQSYLADEIAHGTPVVFLDRPGHGAEGDTILIDNRGGAFAAVAELLEQGHTRIAILLDSLDIYTMQERHAGALEAFAACERPADPRLIVADLHSPRDARDALHRLLTGDEPPTAVFCGNNRATIGAVEAILDAAADVAVSGFDDFELSSVLPQRIRIVDYDTSHLGTVAADYLLGRVRGERVGAATTFLLPTRLVDRGRGART